LIIFAAAHKFRSFSRRIVPSQGQGIAYPWDLALGQGEGRGQRRAWDAGTPNANSDVEDENGEAKIVIELVKAPKREE
jgi:hypothetical protein